MSATVPLCGSMFDGTSDELTRPLEISTKGNQIRSIGRSVTDIQKRSSLNDTARDDLTNMGAVAARQSLEDERRTRYPVVSLIKPLCRSSCT
jgi:hypothetical protein